MKRLVLLVAFIASAAEAQIASDFEIRHLEQQLDSRDVVQRISANLNLGDIYASRSEQQRARTHFQTARELANRRRAERRRDSDLSGYATATAYEALATSRLGNLDRARELFDEVLRYGSDTPRLWNLFASAMLAAGELDEAVAAARSAIVTGELELNRAADPSARLDLEIWRYTLASALAERATGNDLTASEQLLRLTASALASPEFRRIAEAAAEQEQFRTYSSTRNDIDAYISLRNRVQLRLGKVLERQERRDEAAAVYRTVLAWREDDPVALQGLARTTRDDAQRLRYFEQAFEANPFSIPLLQEFDQFAEQRDLPLPSGSSTGARVRRGILESQRGDHARARTTLQQLRREFPSSEVVEFLIARNELRDGSSGADLNVLPTLRDERLRSELRSAIDERARAGAARPHFLTLATRGQVIRDTSPDDLARLLTVIRFGTLSPAERALVDSLTFSSVATFDALRQSPQPGTTQFISGTIGGVRFRFPAATTFRGLFETTTLRLTYRVLDVAGDELIVEPVGVEAP